MRKIDRFLQYLYKKGITENKATTDCGLSQGLLHQAKSGKSDLGYKTIDKILDKYQDLNREWLLLGEGSMLRADQQNINGDNINANKVTVHKNNTDKLLELLANKEHSLAKAQEHIDKLLEIIGKLAK